MRAERKTWGDVRIGTIIKDRFGVLWKVTHEKPGFRGLVARDGISKILDMQALGIKMSSPVDIMHLTQTEVEAQLKEDLGAEVYAVAYDGEGVFHCKPFNDKHLVEMKTHLTMMHGVATVSANDPGNSAGMNSKKALIECHDQQHAEPGPRWTPHVHDLNQEVF